MKLVKRGLLIVLAILVLSNLVYATTVDSNLSNDKFGPESVLSGYLNFSFSGYMSLDDVVEFHVGSETHEITLEEIIEESGLTGFSIINESYINSTTGRDTNLVINFPSGGGLNNSVGIDLRGTNPAVERVPGAVNIENISFTIEPTSGHPDDVSVIVGGERVWRFMGRSSGWDNLDAPHLDGAGRAPTSGQDMRSENAFCQVINLTDSNKYKINVYVKRIGDSSDIGLNVTLVRDYPLGSAPFEDHCSEETPCCELDITDVTNAVYSGADCTIKKQIPDEREEYVCIYPTDVPEGVYGERHFSIGTNPGTTVRAFSNGNPAEANFYVFGEYETYHRELGEEIEVNFSAQYLNNYIHGVTGCQRNCLIIPIELLARSSGRVKVDNLEVLYTSSTNSFTEGNFRKVKLLPSSISYSGNINVNLMDLEEVITPDDLDDYEYYVSFDGVDSSEVDFEVVNAPNAFLRYGPFEPGVGDVVVFDGSSSTIPSGRNASYYSWKFGDGTSANGSEATHTYVASGYYDVRLKVMDSLGVFDVDSIVIHVLNTSSSDPGALIDEAISSVATFRTNLDASPEQVRDTANLLGIRSDLDVYSANLTRIKSSYDSVQANASLNSTEKSRLIAPLIQEVNLIKGKLVTGFNVDVSSFSGKVSGLNQIKSCCEFQTEEQKRKLLTAQKNINVNGEARVVRITYIGGTSEEFMVIKKSIVGTGSKIYEFVPFGVSISELLSEGTFNSSAANTYVFSQTSELIYKVNSADLSKAMQIKTAVLPLDLESVQVEDVPEASVEVDYVSDCGDNICDLDEDSISCPEDCGEGSNGLLIAILIILIIGVLVVFFGYFFKGGLLNKGKAATFKSEKDHNTLRTFVRNAMNKNLSEEKIKLALKTKGWKDNQINSVISEIKGPKDKKKGGFIRVKK